jgi:hypothetical protein
MVFDTELQEAARLDPARNYRSWYLLDDAPDGIRACLIERYKKNRIKVVNGGADLLMSEAHPGDRFFFRYSG